MEAAHKRPQQKNIKKQWYPLQIQRNSKTTFIKIVVFFFYLLSFELYKYWMGTYKSKLERFYCFQEHAVYTINFKDRFTHAQSVLHDMKALYIFQINLFYIIFSMFKCKKQMGTRQFPLEISPRTIAPQAIARPQQFPPENSHLGQLPQHNLQLGKLPSDNCTRTISSCDN